MEQASIEQEVICLLREQLERKLPQEVVKKNENENFFVKPFYFNKNDMIYFFFLLEDKFKVHFSPEDIDNETFYTLSGITKIIQENLECKH